MLDEKFGVTLVSITDAARRYRGKPVLKLDRLEIRRDQSVAVVGPNGSGKSTLLRILAGITPLSTGQREDHIEWTNGVIGYLPQSGGVYDDLTVAENAKLYQRVFNSLSEHDGHQELRVACFLDRFDNTKIRDLSGGYVKIAALAAMLSVQVDFLLLDEPSAELNAEHVDSLGKILKRIAPSYKAIIVADHSPVIVDSMMRQIRLVAP